MNTCPGRSPLAAFGALTIGRFSTVDRGLPRELREQGGEGAARSAPGISRA